MRSPWLPRVRAVHWQYNGHITFPVVTDTSHVTGSGYRGVSDELLRLRRPGRAAITVPDTL